MSLGLADLERKFFQEDYAPGLSTGQVIERRNLVNRPSFEDGNTGWMANSGNITVVVDSTRALFGTKSYKGTWNILETAGLNCNNDRIPVTPGKTYTVSGYMYVSAALQVSIQSRYRVSIDGAEVSAPTTGVIGPVTPNTWQRFSLTTVCPVGATYMFPQFNLVSAPAGSTLNLDGVMVEESSELGTYFDGDTPDFTNGTYEWEGTPHQSASRLVVPEPVVTENLVNELTVLGIVGTDVEINFRVNGSWNSFTYIQGVSSNRGIRHRVPLDALQNEKTYYFGIELYNPMNTPISVDMDWCDDTTSKVSETIPAGESKILKGSGTRLQGYDSTYRFLDVHLLTPGTIWFRRATVSSKPFGAPFDGYDDNAFWTGIPILGSGLRSNSRLIDVNSRDQNYLEYSYWAKRSGLTPKEKFSYADHMLAALRNEHDPVAGDPSSVVRKNLYPNPSFEVNTDYWQPAGGSTTIDRSNNRAVSGTQCGTAVSMGGATSILLETSVSKVINVEVGKTYTASAYGSTDLADTSLDIYVHKFRNNTYQGTYGASGSVLGTTAFSRLSKTFVAQEPQVMIGLRGSRGANYAAGDTVYWDAILLEEGSNVNSYIDGDSPNARWTGTPYASISELTDPLVMSSTDLLVSRYMAGSGLPGNMSISDHMVQYFKNKLGL